MFCLNVSARATETTTEKTGWVDRTVMPASVTLGQVNLLLPGPQVDPGGEHDSSGGSELGDDRAVRILNTEQDVVEV